MSDHDREHDDAPENPLLRAIERTRRRAQAQVERQRELAPAITQLPLWSDEKRGLPNSLARGGLFTAAKSDENPRPFLPNHLIETLSNIHVEYQGLELRQDDASVFMTTLHIARHLPLGEPIHFTAYSMLRELGWSINTREYQHLRECFGRLSANNVVVRTTDNSAGYAGSLVRSFAWQDEAGQQLSQWVVLLEPNIAALFAENSYTLMEWGQRRSIGGRAPLALWLHSFLCTHREPLPMSVRRYHELSASRAKNIADFRARLKLALQKLVEIDFLVSYQITGADIVHVERSATSPRGRGRRLIRPDA